MAKPAITAKPEFYIERRVRVLGGPGNADDKPGELLLSQLRDEPAYVLLGDPGAGKSTALWHESRINSNDKYLRAVALLQGAELPENGVAFIDALDEVRAGGGDQFTPVTLLLQRLRAHGVLRFRLSCREMDWFGDSDRASFEALLPAGELMVVTLRPFESEDLSALISHEGEADPPAFINRAHELGLHALLTNPTTAKLLVRATRQSGWPQSKHDVYRLACRSLVKEDNSEHAARTQRVRPPDEELLDAAGALCAAMLLSAVGALGFGEGPFSGDVLAWSERPSALLASPAALQAALQAALDSRLFSSRVGANKEMEPAHRTVAEYLAARYLSGRLRGGLSVRRLLAMTCVDGRVVSSLRGLNAWLATLCDAHRSDFIAADPLGVALYGDALAFSQRHRQQVFEGLAREANQTEHFRMGHWQAMPNAALASPDMAPYLAALMNAADRSAGHLALLDIVLDILDGAKSLLGLAQHLESMVGDDSYPMDLRDTALRTWMKVEADDPKKSLELLARLGQQIPRPDRLLQRLVGHLYPTAISLAEAFQYVALPDGYAGGWAIEWSDQIAVKTPDLMLPAAAQAMLAALRMQPPDSNYGPDSCAPRLLLRLLQVHGDAATPAQLREWLSLTLAPDGDWLRWDHWEREHKVALSGWLSDRPGVYKALFWHLILQAPDGDEAASRRYFNSLDDRLLWAAPPKDLGLWLLHQAGNSSQPEVIRFALRRALSCLFKDQANDRLSLELIEAWCADVAAPYPEVIAWKEAELSCDIDGNRWQTDQLASKALRQAQFEARREQWLQPYRAQSLLTAREPTPKGLFSQLAAVYLGQFIDIPGKTPEARLALFFADDSNLIKQADAAMRLAHLQADLPDVGDILRLENQGKRYAISGACLIGANLQHGDDSLAATQWPDPIASRLLAFHLTGVSQDDPPWLETLINDRPDLVADAYLRYATGRLRAGHSYLNGWHRLGQDANFAPITARIMLPLLLAWPTRNTTKQAQVRQQIHDAAWAYLLDDDLKLLAAQKLASRSLAAAQRVHWLAVQTVLRVPKALQGLLAELDRSDAACDELLAQASLPGLSHQLEQLPLPTQSTLWQRLARRVQPADIPRDAVTGWLNRLAAHAGNEAAAALDAWLADDSLHAWHQRVRALRYQQRAITRDSQYQPASADAVAQMLANRGPASVADLQALVLDQLDAMASEIQGGDAQVWAQFWCDKGASQPQDEDDCRNVILPLLRANLTPLAIDIAPAQTKVDASRCDLQVTCLASGQRSLIPIEIKRACHPDLWTAMRTQLIDRYAQDPAAQGHGIYLVLWFGPGNAKRLKPHPMRLPVPNPTALARLLEEALRPEERSRIQIVVLDVSAHQHPDPP